MSAAEERAGDRARAERVFCTLFDSAYLSRGLAMYESLARHCGDFVLYVLPIDDQALRVLQALALRNVVVVPLGEFEDAELLRVKPARSRAEYCWTCTPSIVLHVLTRYGHPICTYLDADIQFLGPPDPLLAELAGKDVLITEHRYSPRNDFTAVAGVYCVQFVSFRNTARGLAALRWWREACIESCEINPQAGKWGDQKYLDDWTRRFEGVHVLQHLGGGLAPWNIEQYAFDPRNTPPGREIRSGRRFQPVFYHFHGLRLSTGGRVRLTGTSYLICREVIEYFYRPYLQQLHDIGGRLAARGFGFDPHGRLEDAPPTAAERALQLARRALGWVRHLGAVRRNRNFTYFLDEFV